jgi:hypothetical protein
MGFISYQLTLNGNVQRLSDALPNGGLDARGQLDPTFDVPLRAVTFQGLKANTNDIFIGSTNLVSSTVHAFRVDSTDSAPPIIVGSYDGGGSKPSDFYVKGTNAEVLLFGGVTY